MGLPKHTPNRQLQESAAVNCKHNAWVAVEKGMSTGFVRAKTGAAEEMLRSLRTQLCDISG